MTQKWGFSPKNVGIFGNINGGDMWGFLIVEVGISTLNFLDTLVWKFVKITSCSLVLSDWEPGPGFKKAGFGF